MSFSIRVTAASILLTLFLQAQAHDPAEHAKAAAEAGQAADCSAIDHSTMDPGDPVAQALMAKCGMHKGAHDDHDGHPASEVSAPESDKVQKAPGHHGDH